MLFRSNGGSPVSEIKSKLHKNTIHAYSQDVLSFMLGREGEETAQRHREHTKKKDKTTAQGRKKKSPTLSLLEETAGTTFGNPNSPWGHHGRLRKTLLS